MRVYNYFIREKVRLYTHRGPDIISAKLLLFSHTIVSRTQIPPALSEWGLGMKLKHDGHVSNSAKSSRLHKFRYTLQQPHCPLSFLPVRESNLRKMSVLYSLLALALVLCPAIAIDDGYCTDESCPSDGTELLETGATDIKWWDIASHMSHYITSLKNIIKHNIYKQYEWLYNQSAALTHEIKNQIEILISGVYNNSMLAAEVLYNKSAKVAQAVYNKTAEYVEKVRIVIREEANNFLEMLWEEGSIGPLPEDGIVIFLIPNFLTISLYFF